MATILSETKSTGGSPYAYYTVNATASNRTATTVKVKVDITGRLSSSSAVLGSGGTMGLIGYITLHNTEHSITLKTTSEKWSGTTKHTKSATFTIENLEGSQSQLTNIKFRVSRTGSAANDYTKGAAMSSKNCSNLQIGIGHTNPSDVSFTITEKNQRLIDAGIPNDTYVNNLSIKEYNINATLHDGATATDYNIYNGLVPSFNKSTPITIDYSQKELVTWNDTGKVPIRVQVLDNMGGNGYSSSAYEPALYDYIPYLKISLNEATTNARRNGQTSGRVKLNINGTFYNGSIGNVTQTKPIIKYKYWSANDIEPATFDNIISGDNITITNNTFNVESYEIGSINETDSNYFNPESAYRVKVYVEDNFTTYSSQEKQIPVGDPTWSEYKDRVDFKKATIRGVEILVGKTIYENNEGSNGNITLNDSAANYDYLEIYFRTNDSTDYKNSVKIYSPDNALVPLSYPLVATNGTAIYWKTKTVRVSGNSIFSSDGSRYAEATIKATTSSSQKNYVYITRVVGYR